MSKVLVSGLRRAAQTDTLPWLMSTLSPIIYLCVLIPVVLMGLTALFTQRHPKHGGLLDSKDGKPAPKRYLIGMSVGLLGAFALVVTLGIQGANLLNQILSITRMNL